MKLSTYFKYAVAAAAGIFIYEAVNETPVVRNVRSQIRNVLGG